MTVLVSWFDQSIAGSPRTWIVADSRLTNATRLGPNVITDNCAKVFPLRCDFSRPGTENKQRHMPFASLSLGFAFCGAALPATQTYAAAACLLSQISTQHSGVKENGRPWLGLPLQFEQITRYVTKLFAGYYRDVGKCRPTAASASLILAGPCPKTGEQCLAEITPHETSGAISVRYNVHRFSEVSKDFVMVYGSGACLAKATLETLRGALSSDTGWGNEPFKAVTSAIAMNKDGTVGGTPQVGISDSQGFNAQPLMLRTPRGLRLELLGFDLIDNPLSEECTTARSGLITTITRLGSV